MHRDTKKVLQSLHQRMSDGLIDLEILRNSKHYSDETTKMKGGIEIIRSDLVNMVLASNILANDLE